MAVDAVKVELVTRDFNRMLEEFAAIDPAVEFRDIVRGLAVRVVAGALRRTRAADPKKIQAAHEKATFTTLDGKLYKLSNYFHNDELWRRIQNHRVFSLQRKLNARGLAKQSWLHLGRKIGAGPISAPAWVSRANFKGEQYPGDVSFLESGAGLKFQLKITNASPLMKGAGGEWALVQAMAGETKYFWTLLAKHAFRNAATRASKYPGVYVKPQLSPRLEFSAQIPAGMFGA